MTVAGWSFRRGRISEGKGVEKSFFCLLFSCENVVCLRSELLPVFSPCVSVACRPRRYILLTLLTSSFAVPSRLHPRGRQRLPPPSSSYDVFSVSSTSSTLSRRLNS